MTEIDLRAVQGLLPDFLPRQRWFAGTQDDLQAVEIVDYEMLRDESPLLLWTVCEAWLKSGERALYQVPIGARELSATERFLEGKGRGFLGDIDTDEGPLLLYDALVDPELALDLAARVAPDEPVRLVRPLNVEQSNTSIVFDERLILKVFRRLGDGANPDVEVTRKLADVGFTNISAPVAEWHRDGRDLAVMRRYLVGASDGWSLAQTSLRDLYDRRVAPSDTGGDFAPEAHRLGETTARMHVALADAFGTTEARPAEWVADMKANLARVGDAVGPRAGLIANVYQGLEKIDSAGRAIRVHGDYHLGQTMRADDGWYVLDFEGEPARPLAERTRPSSPLKDVAGMVRSFHYAAQVALLGRVEEADEELAALAETWQQRGSDAFIEGYLDVDEIARLLPADDASLLRVLDAFTLDKAVYEVGYESAFRPAWAPIPLSAVERLLVSAS